MQPADVRFVSLSPSATAAARERHLPLHRTSASFSDMDHARCAAVAHQTVAQISSAPGAADIAPGIMLMARQAAWGHACLTERLQRTVPSGPWLVRDADGKWTPAGDWQTLQQILLPRIWNYGLAHLVANRSPRFPLLLKALARWAATRGRHSGKPWVAAPSRKLKNEFSGALIKAGARIAVLQPAAGNWKDYGDVLRNLRDAPSVQTFPIAPLASSDRRVHNAMAALDRLGDAIGNARVRAAWQLYRPYLSQALPSMLALTDEGAALIRRLHPRAAVSYETNSWNSAALMQASGVAGVKRVIFNHNSQPPSTSPIANLVLETLFRQRTCNTLTDVTALWSPGALPWLTQQDAAQGRTTATVRLQYPTSHYSERQPRTLRILHAGNYQNWSDFFPWIAETADEYLDGIEALARVVSQLDNIELTVRVRPKREVDAKAVEERLGKLRNVRISGIEQDFLEQLAEHDLLVAHFSTTVEQALQMGKPVLLWGNARRYHQFSAQTLPPSGVMTHSVYSSSTTAELAPMLSALRDAVRPMAATIACTQQYGFDNQAHSLEQFADLLVGKSLTPHP